MDDIAALAASVSAYAVDCRRHLHQYPELSFQEQETSEFVAGQLRGMGYGVQTGLGGHGLKAVLVGERGPGPVIALRADMDALPIQEETGLPFASTRPGIMHACGHDVHTAVLLGTAKALYAEKADLCGQVVLIFQPGEESHPGGASLMIRDGVLENPAVEAIFGLHVLPTMPVNQMGFGEGPRMAAADQFEITVRGQGGHGAHPYATVDAVYVASELVGAFQAIVSRNINPFDSVVVTVGSIRSGNKHNVIPGEALLCGTIRTMDQTVRESVWHRLRQISDGICAAHSATAKVEIQRGYPVLVNTALETQIARQAAEAVLGGQNVNDMAPSMGAEDFAVFLQHRPGSFGRLGCMDSDQAEQAGLHSSRLMVDDRCISVGVSYYLSLVHHYLST